MLCFYITGAQWVKLLVASVIYGSRKWCVFSTRENGFLFLNADIETGLKKCERKLKVWPNSGSTLTMEGSWNPVSLITTLIHIHGMNSTFIEWTHLQLRHVGHFLSLIISRMLLERQVQPRSRQRGRPWWLAGQVRKMFSNNSCFLIIYQHLVCNTKYFWNITYQGSRWCQMITAYSTESPCLADKFQLTKSKNVTFKYLHELTAAAAQCLQNIFIFLTCSKYVSMWYMLHTFPFKGA